MPKIKKFLIIFSLVLVVSSPFFFLVSPVFASAEPYYHFTRRVVTDNDSYTLDMAAGSDGSVAFTGYFAGANVDFDDTSGTDIFSDQCGFDQFVTKYDSGGSYEWTFTLNDGDCAYIESTGIAMDSSGNTYIGGLYNGEIDFDPSGSTASKISTTDGSSYLAKYDSNGNFIWVRTYGALSDSNTATVYDVEIEGSGVYIIGKLNPGGGITSFDLDGTGGTNNRTVNAGQATYISKHNTDGNFEWGRVIETEANNGGSFSLSNHPLSITGTNVYFGGSYSGGTGGDPMDFGDSTASGSTDNHFATGGNTDGFLTNFNTDGSYNWTKIYTSVANTSSFVIHIDSNNSGVYFGDVFLESNFDFDPNVGTDLLSSAGQSDIFISHLTSSGTYGWTKRVGSTDGDELMAFSLDNAGGIYYSGMIEGTVDMDPGAGTDNHTPDLDPGTFLSSLDSSGNYDGWTFVSEDADNLLIDTLKTNQVGDVFLSGGYFAEIDLDLTGGTELDDSPTGTFNAFFSKYSDDPLPQSGGPSIRVVLRDSENTSASSDVEVWFDTPIDVAADTSILMVYETAFTGGSAITTSDVTATCDTDGIDPISGSTMTNVTVTSSENGYLELDTNADTCSDYVVVDINGGGGNQLTNPSSPGNYSWSVSYDVGGNGSVEMDGATLAYVANENDINVTALVTPIIDLELYQTGSDTLLSPNSCALGVLSINTVSSCSYDLGTGTNNTSGLTVKITSDGNLRNGAETINACSGTNCNSDSTVGVTAGSEEYGIQIFDLGGGEYTAANSFSTADQAIPASPTNFATTSTTGNGTQNGQAVQRMEIRHKASIDISTTQGGYSHVVTFSAFSN